MAQCSYEGLLRLFAMLDTDENCSISLPELKRELKHFGLTDEECEKFMHQFDLNKDEEITLDEYRIALGIPFTAPYPKRTKQKAENEGLMSMFAQCDQNRDGMVDRRELLKALSENKASSEEIQKVISKLDLNNDEIVTIGEFKVAMGMTYEPRELWDQLFSELDKNRSGNISSDEIKTIIDDSGMHVLKDVVEEWIANQDRNGDGKLSYEEFMTFVGRQAEKPDYI